MEFGQSYNGAPGDWNFQDFPSPTATPTTSTFNNVLQTPKTASLSNHFQDAFTTPQMPTYTTPQQSHYPSMTPVQGQQTSSETLRANYYANIQTAGGYGAGNIMPPPGQVVSPTYGNTQMVSPQLGMGASFDPAQMRTPPPTRGTSAKKHQQQHPQQIAFGTPSTIASRRFMTPQQPNSMNGSAFTLQTPEQFPQLQFSPDMYQFANLGPASAPVMPQTRVLWDQPRSPLQPVPQSALDDPFAPASSSTPGWMSAAPQQGNTQAFSFDTPAMDSFPVQAPHPRPASAAPLSAGYAVSNEMSSAGVDPSLLYSSPVRPVTSANTNTRLQKARQSSSSNGNLNREINAQAHTRSETMSSADTATSRSTTNLHRSNTTGAVRPKSAHLSMNAAEALSRSNGVNPYPRTASPVKRYSRPSLGSISESRPRQRTSVILTVDENGMARAETIGRPEIRRVDPSPTRSIRERYPALFDSDSSDAESDTSDQASSRPTSFVVEKRDERRAKAAKLDPPVENLEGLTIPRSGSSASMKKGILPSRAAVQAVAQLRRQGSLRRSTPSRNSMNRRNLTSSSATSLIDTAPMDISTTQQQAMDDIEQSHSGTDGQVHWTFNPTVSTAESALESHNRRWSMMSFEHRQLQQSQAQAISPQHYQQPRQFSNSNLGNQVGSQRLTHNILIRCVCGVQSDTGQPLIRCSSCTQYLHTGCVGVHHQAPPPSFTCFLCTRPPSHATRRGTAIHAR